MQVLPALPLRDSLFIALMTLCSWNSYANFIDPETCFFRKMAYCYCSVSLVWESLFTRGKCSCFICYTKNTIPCPLFKWDLFLFQTFSQKKRVCVYAYRCYWHYWCINQWRKTTAHVDCEIGNLVYNVNALSVNSRPKRALCWRVWHAIHATVMATSTDLLLFVTSAVRRSGAVGRTLHCQARLESSAAVPCLGAVHALCFAILI